jgi:hypothetical protein
VYGLGVHAFAHAPRRGGEMLHRPRNRLREPERAADREQQRQAGDREQDVADPHVRRRGLREWQLHGNVDLAAVVQERPQQRQVRVALLARALWIAAVGV